MGLAAVAALVVGVLVSVLARSADSDRAEPGHATGDPTPSVVAPTSPPTKPRDAKVEAQVPGVGGLNIRYLGRDGQTKRLDVLDFPR